MKVRPAEERDLPQCMSLSDKYWGRSIYSVFTFDPVKAKAYGLAVIQNPWAMFWVAEDEGKIIGFVIAHLENPAFSTDLIGVHDYLFVSEEDRGRMAGIQLMRVYDHWAQDNKARMSTFMPAADGFDERWISFAEHLGFKKSGICFKKEY